MLSMPSTSIPFSALAERIASDFVERGISIEDGVVRVAKERELRPEEVRRLVEKSNTAASVAFLRSADDKKSDFGLAAYDDVIKRTHPKDDNDEEGKHEKSEDDAGSTEGKFPVTREGEIEKNAFVFSPWMLMPAHVGVSLFSAAKGRALQREIAARTFAATQQAARNREKLMRTAIAVGAVPAAALGYAGVQAGSYFGDKKNEITPSDVYGLRKAAEKQAQEKIACEISLQEGVDKLTRTFMYRGNDAFLKFAADAEACCGSDIEPVLDALAQHLGADGERPDPAEIIDDRTEEMRTAEGIKEDLHRHAEASRLLEELQKAIAAFNESWEPEGAL